MLKNCLNCGVEFEGAPQARFHSDACRKAYSRTKLVDASLPSRDVQTEQVSAPVELEKPIPPPTPCPPVRVDAERYVSEAVRGAEIHFSQTCPQATLSTKTLAETLERAERYARWRHQGFHDGEIARL